MKARGDVVRVKGPADVPEIRDPAGDGHVPQVPPAVDELRPGEQGRDQAQVEAILRHLAGDTGSPVVKPGESLQVLPGDDSGAPLVQPADTVDWAVLAVHHSRQGLERLAHIAQLTRAKNL